MVHPIAFWKLGLESVANPFKDNIGCWCEPEQVQVKETT